MNRKLLTVFALLVVVVGAVLSEEEAPAKPKPTVLRQRRWNSVLNLHAKSARNARHHQKRHGHLRNVKPEPRWRGALQNAWNNIQSFVNSKRSTTAAPVDYSTTSYPQQAGSDAPGYPPAGPYPPAVPGGYWVPVNPSSESVPVGQDQWDYHSTAAYPHPPAGPEHWAPAPAVNEGLHWGEDSTHGYADSSDLPHVEGGYWVPVDSNGTEGPQGEGNGTGWGDWGNTENSSEGYWHGDKESDSHYGTEGYGNQEYSTPDWQHESNPGHWYESSEGYHDQQSTPGYWQQESNPAQWDGKGDEYYWDRQSTPGYWEYESSPDYWHEHSDGHWGGPSTPDYWNYHTEDYWHQPATEDYYWSREPEWASTPDYWGHSGNDDYWYSTPDYSYGPTEEPYYPGGAAGSGGQPPQPPPVYQPVTNNGGCSFTITIMPGGCGQPIVQQGCSPPQEQAATTSQSEEEHYGEGSGAGSESYPHDEKEEYPGTGYVDDNDAYTTAGPAEFAPGKR